VSPHGRGEHVEHPVAGGLPRELPRPYLCLRAEFGAAIGVGEQFGDGGGQFGGRVDECAGDTVDDRIGQSLRAAVTDGRDAVLRGLDHREPPAFLAGRHHVQPGPRQQEVLAFLRDVPVKGDGVADAEFGGEVPQVLLPPAAADDVEVQSRDAFAQRGDRGQCVLDLLVRHEPRQHAHAGMGGAGVVPTCFHGGGQCVRAVPDHRDAVVVDTEPAEFVGGRQRHGQVLVASVHPRGELRFDPPAELGHPASGDGPLFAVAVVHQDRHGCSGDEPREERDAVLGVDDRVGAYVLQRPESEAAGGEGGEGPRVDAEAAAPAADVDAAPPVAACRARVRRGTQGDLDAAGGETGADLLEVPLASTSLRMPAVTPAEQQNLPHAVTPRSSADARPGRGVRTRGVRTSGTP